MQLPSLNAESFSQFLSAHFPDTYLVTANVLRGGKHFVGVTVDTDEGIGVDTLAKINRQLRAWLETHGLIDDTYEIQVSSPGLGEPLRMLRQYLKYRGRTVACVMKDGTKHEGVLLDATEAQLHLMPAPDKKSRKKTDPAEPAEAPKPLELAMENIKETTIVVTF